jgi:hypothetical protein
VVHSFALPGEGVHLPGDTVQSVLPGGSVHLPGDTVQSVLPGEGVHLPGDTVQSEGPGLHLRARDGPPAGRKVAAKRLVPR